MNRVSNDLISLEYLLNCAEYDDNWRLIIPYETVENAPTSFDKEKVIEELEDNMKLFQIARLLEGTELLPLMGSAYGYCSGMKDAAEIIEKGGIE